MEKIKAGDQAIAKYYQRTLDDPDQYVFTNIGNGIERILSGTNVIRVDESGLKSYLKYNPSLRENIHIFGEGRPYYPGFIFRKTSPLTKIFQRTVQRLRERGTLYQMRTIWEGRYTKRGTERAATAVAFGPGQALAAYALIIVALCLSALVLCFEMQWKKWSGVRGEFNKDKLPTSYNPVNEALEQQHSNLASVQD